METRVSTGYDFVQNGVTYTQLRFERDLAGEWTSTGHLGTNANWDSLLE
jgi:hypothetical protein